MRRSGDGGFGVTRTLALTLTVLWLGCQPADETRTTTPAASTQPMTPVRASVPQPPPAFEPMPSPEDNPMGVDKMELGRKLFFDHRISGDGSRSCYSCHMCENGLTDGRETAVGAFEKKLTRSSPSLWNIGYHEEFYWDGRSPSLEKQALAAWKGGNMGADPVAVVATINAIPGYREEFLRIFGAEATPENVVMALSTFERTIFCGTTAWDRFNQGEKDALSEAAQRGWNIWREKAGCGSCHAGILLTDLQYHNVGIGMDKEEPDIGRVKVTGKEADTGAFKTPTLRDITRSAPYFHDGSVATLEEAVDLMLSGGVENPYLDTKNLQPVELTAEEKADLIEFLGSLQCECDSTPPELPGL
jgi:cytochrome c peroxidase